MRLCDRAAIIHKGRIFGSGTIPEIMELGGVDNLEEAFIRIVGA